ncbi:GTPase-associated system all-helical protein GASH [Chryseobacterium sp. LAM-KRS1]|uniref:GTPase-associated system all-helical protein GASH n=1 Tax=Chryseobacterium sp. LAM-KRS1 TaxID=2715754 RepID=UPI001553FCA5|nr:GTPase-associated system all-helical protein GASH [Chryseobacterium sp. LAM-KRS1]
MLQKYLNANLLNVTDDDDHKKLLKSSEELTKKLLKSKAKVALFTLIAIDPDIDPENPSILEVKALIIKHWATFSTNAKDTALVFIRAVIFDSLSRLLDKDGFSETIWFASRNIIKYRKLIGKEKEIIFEFLTNIGKSINQKGIQSWSIEPMNNSAKQLELKTVERYLLSEETLTKYLEDAAGPQGKSGAANFASPNPYWSTQQTHWSLEFAPRASKGIKINVDASLKAIAHTVNENSATIQKAINSDLLTESDDEKQRILALRSQLLWWKEAGYSDSTDQAYDEINSRTMGLVLACDYAEIIPIIYPKSVDYFLKHTYRNILKKDSGEVNLKEFFDNIKNSEDQLNNVIPETDLIEELPNLLNFVSKLSRNQVNISQVMELTGIPEDTEVKEDELIVWLFHDFLLLKVLKQK